MSSVIHLYVSQRMGVLVRMDQTEDGLFVFGPCLRFDSSFASEDLGLLVLAQLDTPTQVIPRITHWKGLLSPFLEVSGERSWSGVQKKFQNVLVEMRADRLVITPTRNGGAAGEDKGFHELLSATTELASPYDASSVGTAIRASFALCT